MGIVDYTVEHPEQALTPTQQRALLALALSEDDYVCLGGREIRRATLNVLQTKRLVNHGNDEHHVVVTRRGLKAAIRLAQS